MKTSTRSLGLLAAFSLGALASLATGALATEEDSPTLPTPAEIGDLYGFPVQSSHEGCEDFVEFADPLGYCMEDQDFTGAESTLVGWAISGRQMSTEETTLASGIFDAAEMKSSSASEEAKVASESDAEAAAEAWWQETYGPES